MWVYIKTEPNLWTVGFYDQIGDWNTDSDWGSKEEAAAQVSYLNGGAPPAEVKVVSEGERTHDLWQRLLDAQRALHRSETPGEKEVRLSYRNGLMDAYVSVTGQDSESVYEALQETLQAEHEIALARGTGCGA